MSSNPPLQVPFKLIENTGRQKYPEFEKHRCAYMCSIMGEIHNCIFRALNSAYLNSERVKPGSPDVPNLLMFCHFVCQLMGAHHDWEETSYFPALEKFAGAPGLLKSNVEEHGTFEEPLSDFNAFCINPNTAKLYSPEKFRAMIDEFAPALGSHLHAEPETLYRLRHFDSTELEKVSEEQNKIVVAKGDSWT
jgi:hemerythrin-like domain-containing protein